MGIMKRLATERMFGVDVDPILKRMGIIDVTRPVSLPPEPQEDELPLDEDELQQLLFTEEELDAANQD